MYERVEILQDDMFKVSTLLQVYLPAQGETVMAIGANEINIRFPRCAGNSEGDMESVRITAGRTDIYFSFRFNGLRLFP
jgi:hypothetical protein